MELKPQVTVFLENQPGTLSTVCRLLKKFDINIQAFTVFGTVDHGVLRIIVDKPQATKDILGREGFLAIESKVIEIQTESTPGILYKLSMILAKEKINIEYGYGSSNESKHGNRFFLQASNNNKAMQALKKKFEEKRLEELKTKPSRAKKKKVKTR